MLTQSINEEYGRKGIAAFSLQPGVVDTGMQVRIRSSGMNEISRIPRADLAPPEHAAAIMAWLCDKRPVHHLGRDLTVKDAQLAEEAGSATG